MGRAINFTGQKFDKLTAIERTGKNEREYWLWLCECECGNKIIVPSWKLGHNRKISCGCTRKKHGQTGTRLYRIWAAMKARCSDPNNKCHEIYIDKGITVCEEWQNFEPFYKWATENGYSDELTIDRIDVNGNYCPENCRWATATMQGNNKSNNRLITYKGETKTLSQWAKDLGVNYSTLHTRITRSNMSVEEALTKK